MYRNIFDSHAHYTDTRFDDDRHELLASMPEKGVAKIMSVSTDIASTKDNLMLCERYDFIFTSAGYHPSDIASPPEDWLEQLKALAASPKIRAIGEIGLEYHYDFTPKDVQLAFFEAQLALANELELPVIVHDRDAHADTMALLKKYKPKGVVHCYSGSAEMAAEILRLGMSISFTGAITFKNAKKPLEALRAVPLERLLLETDCPYMAPEPHRGKRCDSTMIPLMAEAAAKIYGIAAQQILDTTYQNACELFGV